MLGAMSGVEHVIAECFQKGLAVHICLKGQKPFAAGIERFVNFADLKIVILKPFTLYGHPLEETNIHFHQIERAVLLPVRYDDPFYVNLRTMKGVTS